MSEIDLSPEIYHGSYVEEHEDEIPAGDNLNHRRHDHVDD